MSQTPRLSLPLIGDHTQKHLVMNEALLCLDALVSAAVLSRTLSAQPSAPADGDGYIIGPSSSGAAWSAFAAGNLVRFSDGFWSQISVPKGMSVYVADEDAYVCRTIGGWTARENLIHTVTNARGIGIGTTADLINVLALKGPAALFSGLTAAEGGSGDISLTLNKELDGDTAQLLFQKSYSTRAILGLLGDNSLTLKVSPDGTDWTTALTVKTNGKVSARWGIQPPTWPMRSSLGSGGKRIGPMGMTATANGAVTANRLYVAPVVIPYDLTATALGVRVTIGAAGNVRLGIYADNQGSPGALLLDAGTVSTASAGLVEAVILQPLSAGIYWLAAVFSAAPTVNMATSGAMGHDSTSVTSASVTGYSRSFTYAALPGDESGQSYTAASGTVPALLVG